MNFTSTVNPLHFEDLEPHRFEDLVRQLIYDFRDWKSIEATGKLGSDDGVDILAIENVIGELKDEEEHTFDSSERIWIIQCKREKSLTPKKISKIVENDIEKQIYRPYGYILVASSDFSKKSRDLFKRKLNEYGISEFYLFGKSELEDLIFLPKYDHLLFAYFGLSLQKRRNTIKSKLGSRLTTKRKLIKTLGDFYEAEGECVLIRPSEQFGYPKIENPDKLLWRYYELAFYQPHDSISFVTLKHYAFVNWESGDWDILDKCDLGFPLYPELFDFEPKYYESQNKKHNMFWEQWNKIEKDNQGFYIEARPIHFDRITLIDEIGDMYNRQPHLIIDFKNNSPFDDRLFRYIKPNSYSHESLMEPELKKRIKRFA